MALWMNYTVRPWRSREFDSTINLTQNQFEAHLDVQQFQPEEISVRVAENVVIVEGKHAEKEDQHGLISRHFLRKYVLPEGCDANKIESKLSSDGVLKLTAPRSCQERSIPVIQTGLPSRPLESNPIDNEE